VHGAVTVHACSHRQIFFPPKRHPLGDLTVTGLAFNVRLCMLSMVKAHKTRNLINANPINLPILLTKRCQLFFRLRLRCNGRVALQALVSIRHIHHFSRVRISVTYLARLLQCRNVQLVIKCDRLFRTFRLVVLSESSKMDGQHQHDDQPQSHRLPARICSAM
jgi:hypothetical protein